MSFGTNCLISSEVPCIAKSAVGRSPMATSEAKAFAEWRFGKHSSASIAPTINSTNAWAIHTNRARGRQRNPSQMPGM